jgi:hypothetical protein
LTLAITEIPDGMASALLAGVSPAFGLYSVIAGGAVGAILVSTTMMSVVTTSALSVAAGEEDDVCRRRTTLTPLPPSPTAVGEGESAPGSRH